MKFIRLFKSIPFLSALITISFLCIINQKEYTKLRILVWTTPHLTLGTYLAISSGAGFIFSYFLTSSIASINKSNIKKEISNKTQNEGYAYESFDTYNNMSYKNVLIERDINDPSPTIEANFRVIGKIKQNKSSIKNIEEPLHEKTDFTDEPNEFYYKNESRYHERNVQAPIINDWFDESYNNW